MGFLQFRRGWVFFRFAPWLRWVPQAGHRGIVLLKHSKDALLANEQAFSGRVQHRQHPTISMQQFNGRVERARIEFWICREVQAFQTSRKLQALF